MSFHRDTSPKLPWGIGLPVEGVDPLLGRSDSMERDRDEIPTRDGRCQSLSGLPVGPLSEATSSRLRFCSKANTAWTLAQSKRWVQISLVKLPS